MSRRIVLVAVFCIISLFTSSCGKKKTSDDTVVSNIPDSSDSSGSTSEFNTLDGSRGVSVVGQDIPFGDTQPDMDKYFDHSYDSANGDVNGNLTDSDAMGSPEADQGTDSYGQLKPDLSTIFKTIYFDYDKHHLKGNGTEVLGIIADFLNENSNYTIVVEGHCDERGANAYNMALGEKRALSVREYLVSVGIAPSRIYTVSYGEEKPSEIGSNKFAWSRNRRVEFRVNTGQ